jgi:hypothetical protein
MNYILKQIFTIVFVFLLILWFQNKDYEKNKLNPSNYDRYKLPILISAILGLLFNINYFYIIPCNTNNTDINNQLIEY